MDRCAYREAVASGTDNRAANVLVTWLISSIAAPILSCCVLFGPALAAVGATPIWIVIVFGVMAWLAPPLIVLIHGWGRGPNRW
jgi:hypothetical protein